MKEGVDLRTILHRFRESDGHRDRRSVSIRKCDDQAKLDSKRSGATRTKSFPTTHPIKLVAKIYSVVASGIDE